MSTFYSQMPWQGRRIIHAEGKALPRNKGINTTISAIGIQEYSHQWGITKAWSRVGTSGR